MDHYDRFREYFIDKNTNYPADNYSNKYRSFEKRKLSQIDETFRDKVCVKSYNDKCYNEYSQNFYNNTIKKNNAEKNYSNSGSNRSKEKQPIIDLFKKPKFVIIGNQRIPFDNDLTKEQLGDIYPDNHVKKDCRYPNRPDWSNYTSKNQNADYKKKVDKILANDLEKVSDIYYRNCPENYKKTCDQNNAFIKNDKAFLDNIQTPRNKNNKETCARSVSKPKCSAERMIANRDQTVNKSLDLNHNKYNNRHDKFSNSFDLIADKDLHHYAKHIQKPKNFLINNYHNIPTINDSNLHISPKREYRLLQKDVSSNKRYINNEESTHTQNRDLSTYHQNKKNSQRKYSENTAEFEHSANSISKDITTIKNTNNFDPNSQPNNNKKPIVHKEKHVKEYSDNSRKNSINFNLNFYFDNSSINNKLSNNDIENSVISSKKSPKYLKSSDKNSKNSQKQSLIQEINSKSNSGKKSIKTTEKSQVSNIFANLNLNQNRADSDYKNKPIKKHPRSKKPNTRREKSRVIESKELSVIDSETHEDDSSRNYLDLYDTKRKSSKLLRVLSYALLYWHYKEISKQNYKKLNKDFVQTTLFRQVDAITLWHCKDLLKATCFINRSIDCSKKKSNDTTPNSYVTIFKNYGDPISKNSSLDNQTIRNSNFSNYKKVPEVYKSPYQQKMIESNRNTNLSKSNL